MQSFRITKLTPKGRVLFLLYLFFIPLLALLVPGKGQAQTKPLINSTLSGRIMDARTRTPLPGARVHIKGTTHEVSADSDGKFSFVTGQKFPYTLIVSFVGYGTREVIANGGYIDVELKELQNELNDVVVVGYVTQQRKNNIGSITKVDGAATKDIPVGSFDAQLQGKVAGVQISSNTGVPGEAINIRVRGATSINAENGPLYVLDGVFINSSSLQTLSTGGKATSPIADINPADIESVEVLKDADATALYGSRGANGVILITTKRGKFNQKPRIALNSSVGWAKAAKLWDLATGPEHATLVNENWVNTGNPFATRPFRPVSEGGRGLPEEQQTYDRLDQVFQTAGLQNYDLSLTGGSAGTKYYIAGGYNKQESILKPITFNRASFKVNLDQKINDQVQIGVSNTFGRAFRNQARAGDGPAGGLLQAALHTPTYLSPVNEQGVPVGRAGFDNVDLLLKYYDVHSTSLRYIGNLYAEIKFSPNLSFRSSVGADYNNYDESEYWNTFLISGSPNGLATSTISQSTSLINEQTLTYRKTLGKHGIGVLVGNTLQSDVSTFTGGTGRGFANNSFKQISSASTTTSSQGWSKNTLASFFSKADYNYEGKYILDFIIRADGSSRFGDNNRWGYFPSAGAAWRLKKEDFLKDVAFISDFKIRASYGITGNQNGIGDFATLGLWSGGSSYQDNPGIAPQQLANPDLQWERTKQFNIGTDLSLFNDRLALEFNYYKKYTDNGLLSLSLPATTGFGTYISNAAEISNKGFELNISSTNLKTTDFSWTTSLNVARNVNKIEKLATPLKYGSRDLILLQEGSPLYSFWLYKELYVDPETGNSVYEDVNGDNQITAADRQIYGNIWPKYFGGLTNNFTYKGFDASVFFSFSYGNKIYNHNRFFGEGGGARDAARVIFASNVDRWTSVGQVTNTPRPDGINNNNYKDGGSRWLEDGSFLRLKALTLGYSLPKYVLQKVKIDGLRFFVMGSNLFTVTNYTGADPESSVSSDQNGQGIDLGTPPQPRSIQVGINLTL
ncbi:outer membrane receptor; ragA protein [Pedobacter sp. BAL39]|uniref:SusC/RagA family TonB-linked outer membrane protein n=1 Tax=Pedobacter sp. BAL39 TaxID=391596 RepID=UPI000155A071|nr:TonB-dependent receptor [Pedobacter sp. BAL39]EDM35564.1 outer membrane receptor; ragA protein [Pedobacter sp. BAL39]